MINLKKINTPEKELNVLPVALSDETILVRKQQVLKKMQQQNFDTLVIYADLEHGQNFEYLVGFLPRFEEALLVLHATGEAFLVLGNENLNKASKARIPAQAVHMPHFSLPNQPMTPNKTVSEILAETQIAAAQKIGLIGWKHYTSQVEENATLTELPYFIIKAIEEINPQAQLENATALMIGENGVRRVNNANEFAHYEFGAVLAGNCILDTMAHLEVGKTEMELAAHLDAYGQTHNVVTIMATGARFEQANMYPAAKKIQLGDAISITTGFKGGLQSRGGYAVESVDQLPENQQDYLEKVAQPYFAAVQTWLEKITIGMAGGELYEMIEAAFPKEKYGWTLNPGHLCGDEEWLASPIYPASQELIRSGMLFQIDIIPSVAGYAGISCESGIFLADEKLRAAIKAEYSEMWARIQKRRQFIIEEIGIALSEEILPTSSATVFCRPFLLDQEHALAVVQ